MVIISQDKTMILNSDNQYTIAEYKTEERAKEVLQEIYKVYSDFTLIKCVNEKYQNQLIIGNINKYFDVYEMPED